MQQPQFKQKKATREPGCPPLANTSLISCCAAAAQADRHSNNTPPPACTPSLSYTCLLLLLHRLLRLLLNRHHASSLTLSALISLLSSQIWLPWPSVAMPPQRSAEAFALPPAATKMAPMHAIHIVGRCLRLVSVYAAYHYVIARGVSLTFFCFVCLLGSAAVFSTLQTPWRGRPLPNSLLVPALVNGGVMAFSLLLWANGLRNCGPVRTILGEYAGAVLGAISTLLFSRNGLVWRRIGGLLAMCAAYYFLSQGWAMSSYSPFSFGSSTVKAEAVEIEEGLIKSSSMLLPAFSGILAAIRRIISRREYTKSNAKKRLHAVTVAAAACFIFPFAMFKLAMGKQHPSDEPHGSAAWAYISTILFGVVLIFYVDTFVEDRLHIVVASPLHIVVTAVGIIIFEYIYGMDFSFFGFIICVTILGLGIFEATATDPSTRDLDQGNSFLKEDRPPVNMSTLPS